MTAPEFLAHHEAHVVAVELVFRPGVAQGDEQMDGGSLHVSRGSFHCPGNSSSALAPPMTSGSAASAASATAAGTCSTRGGTSVTTKVWGSSRIFVPAGAA